MRFVTAILAFALVVLTIGLATSGNNGAVLASHNGGTKCAGCTVVAGLIEQQMQLKNITAKKSIYLMCSYFPGLLGLACDIAIGKYIPIVGPLMEKGETPDTICRVLKMCEVEAPVCRLFPARHNDFEERTRVLAERYEKQVRSFNICTIVPAVCKLKDHVPASDVDDDYFSHDEKALRGSYWRGKDCNDHDHDVYPGRTPANNDTVTDSNCNGIYGFDTATNKSYEEQWCDGTGAMGVAALGDSATAHFRIPQSYFTAATLNKDTYKNAFRLVEDEADWPMFSWSTGHINTTGWSPDIQGPVDSVYKRMTELNHCNHRDFQNLGSNGAATEKLLAFDEILSRNKTTAKPMLLIMSMVGNDVCNGVHDFSRMTTPAEYKKNIMAALTNADATLPNGSHVVLVPLVDGRVLYDSMHDRIHPIGSTNKDVTYKDFYEYLNCLHVSPCWGWMNHNETVRNTTFKAASAMNAQLPSIVSESKTMFKNIGVHTYGNPFDQTFEKYPQSERWKLIEPVDGFHPSQLGNSIIGATLFQALLADGVIPSINPNNAKIKAKFGDQGGY